MSRLSRRIQGVSTGTVLVGTLAWAAAGTAITKGATVEGTRDRTAETMRLFSKSLNDLESGLRDESQGRVRNATGRIHTVALRALELSAPNGDTDAGAFQEALRSLASLTEEMDGYAVERRWYGVEQTLRDARAACVRCHVRFRPEKEERGHYPARANSVVGRVRLLDVDGEPVADASSVLVFLDGGNTSRRWQHARDEPRIDQRSRSFVPRVLPVLVGTTVEFPNNDSIFHNGFSLSETKPFDLGMHEPGMTRSVSMDRTGLVKVYCNIHPDMEASVVVLANPYFTLADPAGHYVLTDVGDGEYTLRAWNDRGAQDERRIVLKSGAWREADLEFQETKRVLTHSNKYGEPYTEKH